MKADQRQSATANLIPSGIINGEGDLNFGELTFPVLLGTILAKCIDLNPSLYQLHELLQNLVSTVRPDINALSFGAKGILITS